MALSGNNSRAISTVGAVVFCLLLCPCAAVWLYASGTEIKLTLAEAVQAALKDNHEIKAVHNSTLAQEKDIGVARSHFMPKVYAEERYMRTTNPGWAFMSKLNQSRIEQRDFNPDLLNYPDAISDYQSSLVVEQPLFAKKAFVGLDMSKTEYKARQEELKRKREEITFQVVKTGLSIVSAKELMRAAEQGVDDALEHHRVAELRYKNGLGQYADSLRASTAVMDARQRRNVALKNVNLAKRALGLLLATSDPVDITDSRMEMPLKDISFYVNAAEGRSDLRAAELRGENAKNNIKMAEASYYPYLGIGGAYQLNDHNQPFGSEGKNWQVMAFLRWDLFDGTKREYERVKAKHMASQAQEYISAMKKGVSFKIYEAYMNVEEARKNIELSREALKTAEEGKRLLKLRYENGLSSLADLLNVQASLEQARAGLVEKENAYRVSVASVSYESGTILQDLNIEN